MRIGGIEPVDIGEQHQKIRPDVFCNDCAEGVVVSDTHLRSRNGIVFVDDGQGSEL